MPTSLARTLLTQDTFNSTFAQSDSFPGSHANSQATAPNRLSGYQQLEVYSRPFVGIGTKVGDYAIVYQIAQTGVTGSQVFTFTYAGTLLSSEDKFYTVELPADSTTDPMRCDITPYTWYDGVTPTIAYTSTAFSVTVAWTGQGGHTTPFILMSANKPTLDKTTGVTVASSTFPIIPIWTT